MVRHDVTDEEERVPLAFFRTAAGGESVREWLQDLPREERKKLGEGLKELEYGWPIGMPLSRPMGEGLQELRVSLESRREARVLFVVQDEQLIALHAFVKKSAKTPKADLDLARQRQRELEKKT
jgi:phage-related protein